MRTDCSKVVAHAVVQRFKLSLAVPVALAVVLALVAVAVWAWPQTPRPFNSSLDVESVVDANTAFAVDLYQRLKLDHENLFFSPYSISTALAMTYAGTRGQTADEMAAALHFDRARGDVHAAFGKLDKRLNDLQRRNITLQDANSVWCQPGHPFTADFLKLVSKDYDARARAVDFIGDPEAARNKINSWVAAKTGGRIADLINPRQLPPNTRMVLCNAIYFKGKWQTQFRSRDTRPQPFYVNTNETVTVPMMSLHAHFKMAYADNDSIRLLELPYVGNDLSMVILLPAAGPGCDPNQPPLLALSYLEEKLTPQNLGSWLAQLDRAETSDADIFIPRFTTTQTFDLADQLKSMGMTSAFSDSADFSGMDGTRDLFISNVVHKAFLEVDEHGTEAAAATSVTMLVSCLPPPPFVVDHPFVLLIRDNASGAILFLGRIIDPTK
jgi:serine protease inhibitor